MQLKTQNCVDSMDRGASCGRGLQSTFTDRPACPCLAPHDSASGFFMFSNPTLAGSPVLQRDGLSAFFVTAD